MSKIINKMSSKLRKFIGCSILEIKIDKNSINSIKNSSFIGDDIQIYFSNGSNIEITASTAPHFYVEADLELKFKNDYVKSPRLNIKKKKITTIRTYFWKKKSLFFLPDSNYLVQIEFYSEKELLISFGFFYMDKAFNKMIAIMTGELGINFNDSLSINDYQNNLYLKQMSV